MSDRQRSNNVRATGGRRTHTCELGPLVGERVTSCGRGGKTKLKVRLGVPRRSEQTDRECPYQIVGLGRSSVGAAYGVDALQALQLALDAVRVRLRRKRCTWEGGKEGDPGFPRAVPYCLAVGSQLASRTTSMGDRAHAEGCRNAAPSSRKSDAEGGLTNGRRWESGGVRWGCASSRAVPGIEGLRGGACRRRK